MKPILTIFTPTYNRAHTIGRTYESLKKQNCKEFIWLIIDGGKTNRVDLRFDTYIKKTAVCIPHIILRMRI